RLWTIESDSIINLAKCFLRQNRGRLVLASGTRGRFEKGWAGCRMKSCDTAGRRPALLFIGLSRRDWPGSRFGGQFPKFVGIGINYWVRGLEPTAMEHEGGNLVQDLLD